MAFQTISKQFLIESQLIDNTAGETINIGQYIQDVIVRKRFLTDAFPLYVIDIQTTEEIRDRMRDHDVKISLRISSFDAKQNSEKDDADEDTLPEDELIFEGILRIYDKPYMTSATKKDEDNEEETNNKENSIPLIYYRVAGIPEELIEKNRHNINRIYNDAKLEEVLINLLTEEDSESKIFIQTSDNQDSFKNILIPPMSLVPAINHLQKHYRIYNGPLACFFDYKKIFIFNSSTTEILNGGNTINLNVLNINNVNNAETFSNILFDSENNNIKLNMKTPPAFQNSEKVDGDMIGSKAVYYSYDDHFNLITRDASNGESFEKTRYFWNPSGLYSEEQEFQKTSTTSKSIMFSLTAINPELITPLSVVSITSDYDYMNGEYQPNEISYSFSTMNKKSYNMIMVVGAIKK